jgi:hypothetical protein
MKFVCLTIVINDRHYLTSDRNKNSTRFLIGTVSVVSNNTSKRPTDTPNQLAGAIRGLLPTGPENPDQISEKGVAPPRPDTIRWMNRRRRLSVGRSGFPVVRDCDGQGCAHICKDSIEQFTAELYCAYKERRGEFSLAIVLHKCDWKSVARLNNTHTRHML